LLQQQKHRKALQKGSKLTANGLHQQVMETIGQQTA
jgi:hypothetical protein